MKPPPPGLGSFGGGEDICPRCRGRLHGYRGPICPWCNGRMTGAGVATESERLLRRLLMVGAVAGLLVVAALFVPPGDWNATNASIFGVIAAFMLLMAWVLSAALVDP